MASLTRLRRRALRWDRYVHRIGYRLGHRWPRLLHGGRDRAHVALARELRRRNAIADAQYAPGWWEPAPHDNACWDGCPCDDPCGYCEQPDCLGDCGGEEYDDGVPMREVETIKVAGGLL